MTELTQDNALGNPVVATAGCPLCRAPAGEKCRRRIEQKKLPRKVHQERWDAATSSKVPSGPCCHDCRFLLIVPGSLPEKIGSNPYGRIVLDGTQPPRYECRRFPPHPYHGYPAVSQSGWCGEFAPMFRDE